MPRHFLSSADLVPEEQKDLIAAAFDRKERRDERVTSSATQDLPLRGRSVALIFEKASTRTRVSFETAVFELGGNPIALRRDELQLGRGEPIEDTARVLSGYVDAIVIRTFGQDRVVRLASHASVPVINALTDLEHPCQALADVMTVLTHQPDPSAVVFSYVGDGNNVAHSLLLAGANAGFGRLTVASPREFEPERSIVDRALQIAGRTGTVVSLTNDPEEACKGATVIYTDVWASMGQETEQEDRAKAFTGFQVSEELFSLAHPDSIVMHCLPAHRGEEIAAGVIDGPSSVVWEQAENRLHTQKALLAWLLSQQDSMRTA